MNRRAAFLIATTDENGVDPHQNPHDTVQTGRALHSLGGAAPHRSQQIKSTLCRSTGPPAAIATTAPPRRRPKSPRDGGRGLQSGYALLPSPAPSQSRRRQSHPVCRAPRKPTTPSSMRAFWPSPTMGHRDLRRLLITGAMSVVRHAGTHSERASPWIAGMLARKPKKLVAMALANKMARIVWA